MHVKYLFESLLSIIWGIFPAMERYPTEKMNECELYLSRWINLKSTQLNKKGRMYTIYQLCNTLKQQNNFMHYLELYLYIEISNYKAMHGNDTDFKNSNYL